MEESAAQFQQGQMQQILGVLSVVSSLELCSLKVPKPTLEALLLIDRVRGLKQYSKILFPKPTAATCILSRKAFVFSAEH